MVSMVSSLTLTFNPLPTLHERPPLNSLVVSFICILLSVHIDLHLLPRELIFKEAEIQ